MITEPRTAHLSDPLSLTGCHLFFKTSLLRKHMNTVYPSDPLRTGFHDLIQDAGESAASCLPINRLSTHSTTLQQVRGADDRLLVFVKGCDYMIYQD